MPGDLERVNHDTGEASSLSNRPEASLRRLARLGMEVVQSRAVRAATTAALTFLVHSTVASTGSSMPYEASSQPGVASGSEIVGGPNTAQNSNTTNTAITVTNSEGSFGVPGQPQLPNTG